MKRELFNSIEWVNVFDEKETSEDEQDIIEHYNEIFDIETEFDGEEFRVWLRRDLKNSM
jgi:beta-glucosidase/6-phospho-beta-glucosidase/beta-galactosidase